MSTDVVWSRAFNHLRSRAERTMAIGGGVASTIDMVIAGAVVLLGRG